MTVDEMKELLEDKPGGMVIFIAVGKGAYIPVDAKKSGLKIMKDEDGDHPLIVLFHRTDNPLLPVIADMKTNPN